MVRPILFNTEMVMAILRNEKTSTRRLVRAKSKNACGFYVKKRKCDGVFMGVYDYDENEKQFDSPQAPPAQVGDILWVRETWSEWTDGYVYKAWTSPYPQPGRYTDKMMKWHPSIHMPKEAARIFLRVTDVRVERLKDMTLDDFLAEGVILRPEAFNDPENAYMQSKKLFIHIWDSTIKKEQYDLFGWDANPWVWVIAFERCEQPEGWCV